MAPPRPEFISFYNSKPENNRNIEQSKWRKRGTIVNNHFTFIF